jgi:hypothetical protein
MRKMCILFVVVLLAITSMSIVNAISFEMVSSSSSASIDVKVPTEASVNIEGVREGITQATVDIPDKPTPNLRFATVGSETGEKFTIVMLPDTQGEVLRPNLWEPITNWIVENKDKLHIVAVVGLGDVTDSGKANELKAAQAGWNKIKDAGIIYVPVRGNHDKETKTWNMYFGPTYFSGKDWYGGSYSKSDTSNMFVNFEAGGQKYLTLALNMNPGKSVLNWAKKVITANADSNVMIIDHSYLGDTGHGLTSVGNVVWNNLVKKNRQIFLVGCGHIWHNPTYYRISTGSAGNKVFELRSDFQATNNGNGYIQVLDFLPKDTISTYAYSTVDNTIDPKSKYAMKY